MVRILNLIEQRKRLQEHFQRMPFPWQQTTAPDSEKRFLKKLVNTVLQNISNENLDVQDLASAMGMSRTQLHRKLKAITNLSTTAFVRKVRLHRAAHLLQIGWGSVSQVAYEVGFNNLSYFTACFKEEYGVLPSKYRDFQSFPPESSS